MIRRLTIAILIPLVIFGAWFATRAEREIPHAASAAPIVEPNEMQIKTGDRFWGMHLDGIVACSSIFVKGGGHMVMITPLNDPDLKCYFHVRGEKLVEVNKIRFTLSVDGEDYAHVNRALDELLAANMP